MRKNGYVKKIMVVDYLRTQEKILFWNLFLFLPDGPFREFRT
jgi:hypothetical protein